MAIKIQDTFTGANGNFVSHSPDVGAAWATYGGAAADMKIVSNTLRLNTGVSGTASSYSTTTISEVTDLYLQFDVKFTSNASYCEVGFTRNGSSYGNSDKFITIEFTDDANNDIIGIDYDTTYSTGITALNTFYTVRSEFVNVAGNTIQTVYVDSNLVLTASFATPTPDWFAGPLAVYIQDASGIQNAIIDNLEFGTLAPVVPPITPDFWTSFVGSHEVP